MGGKGKDKPRKKVSGHRRHMFSHKLFNRHTLKLSYSCMPNMKTSITSHNKNILSNVPMATPQQPKEYNCRKKTECPIDGKYLQENVVYQATITTDAATESYLGLAMNFKERYRNHQSSFRHKYCTKEMKPNFQNTFWTLKNAKKPYEMKCKVLKRCRPYNNVSKKCNLCLHEKFVIICRKDLHCLNKRNELASSCPHRNRYVLKNFRIT